MPQLRYVILRHEGVTPPHFDLMFETSPGSMLVTWRSQCWPIDRPTELEKLADHRRDYLEYEGPISRGRGHVRRVESGVCSIEMTSRKWRVRLAESSAPLILKQIDKARWLGSPDVQ